VCFQTFKPNFGSVTLHKGFFQLLGTMKLSHKHSLETIIVIVTSIWQGHMREWKIFLVENTKMEDIFSEKHM
jgi:hypothetical protein